MLSSAMDLGRNVASVARTGVSALTEEMADKAKAAAGNRQELLDLEREVAELRQRVADLEGRLAVAEDAAEPGRAPVRNARKSAAKRTAKRTVPPDVTPATVAEHAEITKPADET
jgi:cell division septum initiation protein DivIVA